MLVYPDFQKISAEKQQVIFQRAIILWDGISNFEDSPFNLVLQINIFELFLCKNSRPQKFTHHPSEEQTTKPYAILTAEDGYLLSQEKLLQHTILCFHF